MGRPLRSNRRSGFWSEGGEARTEDIHARSGLFTEADGKYFWRMYSGVPSSSPASSIAVDVGCSFPWKVPRDIASLFGSGGGRANMLCFLGEDGADG